MRTVKEINPSEFTTLEEFDEASEFVAQECANIEMQINSAKGAANQYGEYSDSDWYARANLALRLTREKKQTLAKKRAELARMLREQKQRERDKDTHQKFIDVCRIMLPKETYLSIWKRVEELDGNA